MPCNFYGKSLAFYVISMAIHVIFVVNFVFWTGSH